MGIRRRRRKLTTLMSRLDQRVRSVELRPISLLTSAQVAAAVEAGALDDRPDVLVSGSAPYEWTRIQDAYYYPAKLTKNSEDRVEIYVEASLDNLDVNGRLEVNGIHGTSTFDIDVTSDNFTVLFVDAVDGGGVWEDRASWKHDPTQNQLPGVTITNTYSFKPDTLGPVTWTTRQRLQTRRQIESFEITGSTVTLTMNAVHKFKVGDAIFTSIGSDQSNNDESRIAAGIDGLFYITAVTSNTIEYELAAGVDQPTGTITPLADTYVFPVGRRWAQVGSIWVNNSDNTTYYWDGLRWVEYTPSADIGKDGDPPSAPTNFEVTSEPAVRGTTNQPYSKVTLSWTPPTTSESGEPITDLLGYRLKFKLDDPTATFEFRELIDDISTYTFSEESIFEQGKTYLFELQALDSGREESQVVTATHTTGAKTAGVANATPTNPSVESRLGTITVTWNGRMISGGSTVLASSDITTLIIYVSTVNNFNIADAQLVLRTRVFGSDGGFDVLTDLDYNVSYYIRITVANSSGVESLPSAQVTAQVAPLVNTDLIYATLNTWPFVDGTVSANALADGSVTASKILGGAVQAQALAANAVTSLALAANAVTSAAIATGAVTGDAIASSAITAGKIQAGAITAVTIAAGAITSEKITAGAIGAQQIAADAITADKISAGAIGADEIAAGAIIAGKIGASAITAATIAAGAIEAGKIATNAITADKIEAGAITAVKISTNAITADKIEAGAITADKLVSDFVLTNLIIAGQPATGSTSSPGRIEIRGNNNANPGIVAFKNGGGGATNATFRLYTANGEAYLKDTFIDGDVTVSGGRIVAGSTVMSSGSITGGTIRTATSGKRVEMRGGSEQDLRFVDSNGNQSGAIDATTTGLSITGTNTEVRLGAALINIRTSGISRLIASDSGVVLGTAPTTAAAANLRRPSSVDELAIFSSDRRIKENIVPVDVGLSVINSLKPVTFNSRVDNTDKIFSGFIAQDVQEIFPSTNYTVVTEEPGVLPATGDADPEDFAENPLLSINHVELIAYLTKAIQELDHKNKELESRLQTLEDGGS